MHEGCMREYGDVMRRGVEMGECEDDGEDKG